jgi:hypothetical protein
MTDDEFLQAFEACSIPEEQWTHQAHVRMAWLHLERQPFAHAVLVVRAGIQRYNASLNKGPAYHETITQAFLYLIYQRMLPADRAETFTDFCVRNPDLLQPNMAALLAHYRKETLFSKEARETFIPPDLAPLPTA